MAEVKANLYQSGYSGVSPASIASLLQKTLTTQQQVEVAALIRSTELFLCTRTNRQFKYASTTYYETLDAGGSKYYLKSFPIKAVTKIKMDGVTVFGGVSDTLDEGEDFSVYDDYIYFDVPQYSNTNDRRALQVYYTIEKFWGEDVELAIKRSVSELFQTSEYGTNGVQSIGISGGLTISFDSGKVDKYMKTIIQTYRKQNI